MATAWTSQRPAEAGHYWIDVPVFEENDRPEWVGSVRPFRTIVSVLAHADNAADLYVLGFPGARGELVPIINIADYIRWQRVKDPEE